MTEQETDQILMAHAIARSKRNHMAGPEKIIDTVLSPQPVLDFVKKDTLVTTYGTEDEFFGLGESEHSALLHAVRFFDRSWLTVWDSTIKPDDGTQGIELISPILNDKNIHRAGLFQTFLSAAGAKAPLPCAFHVHAGIRNTFNGNRLQTEIMKQMLINYVTIENDLAFIESTLVDNYRDQFPDQKDHLRKIVDTRTINFADDSDQHPVMQRSGRRRSKLNFLPMDTYGTAEFRQHPGSTLPEEKMAWLSFVNGFMKVCIDMIRANGGKACLPAESDTNRLRSLIDSLKSDRTRSTAYQGVPEYYRIKPPRVF